MRKLQLLTGLILSLFCYDATAQCSTIRQQRNITFNTNKDCAPVTVTDFTITYFFNVAQNPADIEIRFEWNDPSNSVDQYGLDDPQFSVDATGTAFTATGTFTYPEDENCVFEPVSKVVSGGDICETSEQIQSVTSWADDNNFGGIMDISPNSFDVCYNNGFADAVFKDNSTFNCNVNQNPDTPNRQARHTQFVYGTNHNATNSIRNLTLTDGGSLVNLTDGNANLAANTTINGVTAAYFGPIDNMPFPADGPISLSFPISAPADPSNQVGSVFEVTLFNWNVCNPYNGNPNSPNYPDAVQTQAYIRIVDPPAPDFQTRADNAGGPLTTVFCVGEQVYFENLTSGATNFEWEFFDDDTGTTRLATSTRTNPRYTFNNAGQKLVRLTASNQNALGSCEETAEQIITISPTARAGFSFYGPTFTNQIDPVFCADDTAGVIIVGFRDETLNAEPDTEWRWEFYDETGVLVESIPSVAGTFGPQTTDFTKEYVAKGEHRVRLIARTNASGCQTAFEDTVFIYDTPEGTFQADTVCAGKRTTFYNLPDPILSLSPRVNDDFVTDFEWDFSYDGVLFNTELSTSANDDFAFFLNGEDISPGSEPASSVAGTYLIALRLRTQKGGCESIFTREVVVNELPAPVLTSDYAGPVCPGTIINFNNGSTTVNINYSLVVSEGADSDTVSFEGEELGYRFENETEDSKEYSVYLVGESTSGCFGQDGPYLIEVLPGAVSGFDDPNYQIIGPNCSLWESTLVIDEETRLLNADQYTWTISDQSGILPGYPLSKSAGEASFHQLDYELVNESSANKVFIVSLEVVKGDVCVGGSQREFLINPSPTATFSSSESDSCDFKTITVAAGQPGLTAYNWLFEPQPDAIQEVDGAQVLTYIRPEVSEAVLPINISLTTENLAGCVSGPFQVSYNVASALPDITADFVVSDDTVMLPDNQIAVTNVSTNYIGLEFHWDFGDGTTYDGYAPPDHSYPEPGNYSISLTVKNAICLETTYKNVVLQPAEPDVDFSADVLEGCSPLTIQFTNESQFAISGSFKWDFGDGKTSVADDPVHTYARGGMYTITLYGENNMGAGSEKVKEAYITVHDQPVASFEVNPTTVRIPDQKVYFKNSSKNATSFIWSFGDGNTSQEDQPTHDYQSVGGYDVELIALNDFGCADTLRIPLAVKAVAGGKAQVPNAFSPSLTGPGASSGGQEGGTINDVFIPRVESVTKFRMLIYNKWGELLFESTDQKRGWDGYFKGVLQPADVYVYKLQLTYSDGRDGIIVGDVTLVR